MPHGLHPPSPLLPAAAFDSVFAPFRGKRVGFVPLSGNTGDRLIEAAARQLFRRFDASHERIDKAGLTPELRGRGFDELAVSGGGNFGTTYRHTYETRQLALATGLPVTVLPQSIVDGGEAVGAYRRVFVREGASLRYYDSLELAPELALGYTLQYSVPSPRFGAGVFLRRDWESVHTDRSASLSDPVRLCRSLQSFFVLASLFETIITDRLHFCIAALTCRRRVYLLPNAYHKNKAMHETWLHRYPCTWLDSLDALDPSVTVEKDPEAVQAMLKSVLGGYGRPNASDGRVRC